jgi:AcrR family transcriptional regulator
VPTTPASPSGREAELLELAYAWVLEHGLSDLSLRPLASVIGSSPRVLLFLFGRKEELVRRILARARADELARLAPAADLGSTVLATWAWLADPAHAGLVRLWVEAFGRSIIDPTGPWGEFARATVEDRLAVLAAAQSPAVRRTARGRDQRTVALAVLRGALLDLLATGDRKREDAAVRAGVAALDLPGAPPHTASNSSV